MKKEIITQSAKVRRISKAERDWAFRNCIDHYAHRLPKGRTTCMDCGHSWIKERQTETCTCPNCKAKSYVLKIGHYWWDAQGQKAVVAIQRVYGRYLDTFSFASPLA